MNYRENFAFDCVTTSYQNARTIQFLGSLMEIVSEYNDQEIHECTTITNCRHTRGIMRKSHTTITRHQEGKQSKATSSLFPIEMIAKLEWTQQNIEQLQTPTMRVTTNQC